MMKILRSTILVASILLFSCICLQAGSLGCMAKQQTTLGRSSHHLLLAISPSLHTGGGLNNDHPEKLPLIFLGALITGIVAVFTPYVYASIPMTLSSLIFQGKTKKERSRNTLYYSLFILLIFTVFGTLISAIITATGLDKLASKWYINLAFFRLYSGLGLSFLGAFELGLPRSWRRAANTGAERSSIGGIFYSALTLPISTFSSTFPLVVLVLLFAGSGGIVAALAGMTGFSLGLSTPYIYPRMINLMPPTVLNQVKVLLGFLALFLSLKFLSNANEAMGWHVLDREIFLGICVVLAFLLGSYMLGKIRLSNDYVAAQNVYGQEFVSLLRLFIVIAVFSFIIYLIPGFWGAPLKGLNSYLPPISTLDRF